MTIDDQIRDEKLQYDINRKAAEISALSSGKIDKYEYLTGKEILPSNQQQIIEQAKFTYSPLGKAFENQTKTIKDQGNKQVEALENLKPKELTKAIKDESFQSKTNHNHSRATIVFNDLINKKKYCVNCMKVLIRINYILSMQVLLKMYVFMNIWILKNFSRN